MTQTTPDSETTDMRKENLPQASPLDFHKQIEALLDKYWHDKADCLSDDGCNIDHEANLAAALLTYIEQRELAVRIEAIESCKVAIVPPHPDMMRGFNQMLDNWIAELEAQQEGRL